MLKKALAQQVSSFFNRTRLNSKAIALGDIRMYAHEGYRVQISKDKASSDYPTVLALDEVLISLCRSSRVITFRVSSKSQ